MINKPQQNLLEAYQQQQREFEKQTSTLKGRIDWMKSQHPEPVRDTWNQEIFDSQGRYRGTGF